MSAVTTDRCLDFEALPDSRFNDLPIKAATDIPANVFVGDDGSGYARNLVAADPFLGISDEHKINTVAEGFGAAGDLDIHVRAAGGVILNVVGVTGVGDVGETVYAASNNPADATLISTSNTAIGRITRWISGTKCVVRFEALSERSL